VSNRSRNPHRKSRREATGAASLIQGRTENDGPRAGTLAARWNSFYGDRGPIWKFGLKFGALMGLYYLLVLTPVCERILYAYLQANASLASVILNWLGQNSQVTEITIRTARFAITVRRGCDAVEPSWFFCAALISFPAPLGRKLIGIAGGVILLQALNLARIVSLYYIGWLYPRFFGPVHLEVWPVGFIVAAISLWVGWIGWSSRAVAKKSHGAA